MCSDLRGVRCLSCFLLFVSSSEHGDIGGRSDARNGGVDINYGDCATACGLLRGGGERALDVGVQIRGSCWFGDRKEEIELVCCC